MKPPYKITDRILELISTISEKLGEVNSFHLNKPRTDLRKKNRIKTIHSSLEIEGNSLTADQITAIFENKKVIAPKKDIIEVKNAIKVYNKIHEFEHCSFASFCKAHSILMNELIDYPGLLRGKSVGIIKGPKLAHIAPPSEQVKPLMNNLFNYLKKDKDLLLIKSCVFHYEIEFIHPFIDGNGRMGRLWQTVILMNKYPVFEFLPIELLIKQRQKQYYDSLSRSDASGNSTIFIEFMLGIIEDSLESLLQMQSISLTGIDRITIAQEKFQRDSFSRQEYLRYFKNISTATASRDLKTGVDEGVLIKVGDKRMTKYKFKKVK